MLLGIYVHIPFCRQKCRYCDFPSAAGREDLHDLYAAALRREIAGRGGAFGHAPADTVYFGGGTPTLLPAGLLAGILDSVVRGFALTADAEITVEANPGTVTPASLRELRLAGFNRVSLGVQSFDDGLLASIGRVHTAGQAREAFVAARNAGFDNISMDLMYGLPGQTVAGFASGLEEMAALGPDHASVYGLKVEDGTVFASLRDEGRLDLPPEEEEEAMYDLAVGRLPAMGLARYEISNFARPGRQCRHNLKYWRYRPYAGFGTAACSFIGGTRISADADPARYIRAVIAGGEPEPAETDRPDAETAMAECAFMALRLTEGLRFDDFQLRFGRDFAAVYGEVAARLALEGLVAATPAGIALTPAGMKLGNRVFAAFLPGL